MAKGQRLSAKQEKFAEGVADGLTLADAYRAAYNAEKMADSTIYSHSSRLAVNDKVAARILHLKAEIDKNNRISGLTVREKVLKRLEELMADDKETPKAVQLNATIWYGKTEALFTEVTETKDKLKDLKSIDREIQKRIKELETQKAASLKAAKTKAKGGKPGKLKAVG